MMLDQGFSIHHEAPSAAEPQPKRKYKFTTKDAKSTKEK
jgi:hypothetical protein